MTEITVPGMSCYNCVRAITRALYAADPAAKVEVYLAEKRLGVEGALTRARIEQLIAEAGFAPDAAAPACCC